MTRCLVTGGAGFIGSHTVDQLLAEGYRVRILDALQPRVHPEGMPAWVPAAAEFVRGDVADPATLREALAALRDDLETGRTQVPGRPRQMAPLATFVALAGCGPQFALSERRAKLGDQVMSSRSVVIAEPVRTAIGAFGGSLKDVPAPDLGAVAIRAAVGAGDAVRRPLQARAVVKPVLAGGHERLREFRCRPVGQRQEKQGNVACGQHRGIRCDELDPLVQAAHRRDHLGQRLYEGRKADPEGEQRAYARG